MCCILFIPRGVEMPDIELFKSVYLFNRDGIGFADTDGNYFRSLSFRQFAKAVKKRKKSADLVVHFRWATHGSVCVPNCHPFKDDGTGVVFAHNGVLPIPSENDMTDSQIFFERMFLPALRRWGWDNPALWDFVNKKRDGSRFAFIHGDEVHLCGEWYKYKGVFFSNMNWMRFRL